MREMSWDYHILKEKKYGETGNERTIHQIRVSKHVMPGFQNAHETGN
jgi:hypothetical protein